MPPPPSNVDLNVLTDRLARLGTHFTDCSGMSTPDWTGEVMGLMNASGYSPGQCSLMSKRLPSLLDTVQNPGRRGSSIYPQHIYEEVYDTLLSKSGLDDPSRDTALPSRVLKRTRHWLFPFDDERSNGTEGSSRSYESKDTASFESCSGHGRSDRHRPPRSEGSNDTAHPKSSRSKDLKETKVTFVEKSRSNSSTDTVRPRSECDQHHCTQS